jgi:hypothetical protein
MLLRTEHVQCVHIWLVLPPNPLYRAFLHMGWKGLPWPQALVTT